MISERSSATTFVPNEPAIVNFVWAIRLRFRPSRKLRSASSAARRSATTCKAAISSTASRPISACRVPRRHSTDSTSGYTWSSNTGIDALGTARLRLGYAFDNAPALRDRRLGLRQGARQLSRALRVTLGPAPAGVPARGRRRYWNTCSIAQMVGQGEGLVLRPRQQGSRHGTGRVSASPPSALHDRMTGAVARIGLNYLFH